MHGITDPLLSVLPVNPLLVKQLGALIFFDFFFLNVNVAKAAVSVRF